MIIKKILGILLAMSFVAVPTSAESNPIGVPFHQGRLVHGKTVLRQDKRNSKRPNAPSRLYMECFYGEGFIEFVIPEGTESLSVRVYKEEEEWTGIVSMTNPIFELPELCGEYKVECIDDSGRTFSGIIEF